MQALRFISGCGFISFALVFVVGPSACRVMGQAAPDTAASAAAPAPVHLTAEQDRRRMMDLLGIKELRPGEEKDANWDEGKANVYPRLPDPLVEKNGKQVTTAAEWWKKRRPEIVEDYDREVLGRTPANLPKVSWEVVSTTSETMGDVPVVTKRLAGHVDNSSYPLISVTIDATLTTPARATGPVPAIMELHSRVNTRRRWSGLCPIQVRALWGTTGKPGSARCWPRGGDSRCCLR